MQQGSMELLWRTSHIHGGNATYVEDLYEAYLMDPNAVPGEWRSYFDTLPRVNGGKLADVPHSTVREQFAQISRMRVRTEATVGVNAAFFTEYRGSADDSGDSGPSLMEIIFHGAIQQKVRMMLGGTDSDETGGKHANGAMSETVKMVIRDPNLGRHVFDWHPHPWNDPKPFPADLGTSYRLGVPSVIRYRRRGSTIYQGRCKEGYPC